MFEKLKKLKDINLSFKERNVLITLEPYAKTIKELLQLLIGVYIFLVVTFKCINFVTPNGYGVINNIDNKYISYIFFRTVNENFLSLISKSILVSAGIELAYMLFTPGPDEAIDPLILGIAGTALLTISDANSPTENSLTDAKSIIIYVISLLILLFLRSKLKTWFPSENK